MLECSRIWLRNNKAKTEVMGFTKRKKRLPVTISVESTPLKQVETFRYLESLVCEDVRCNKEIIARLGMTKSNFRKMRKVLNNMGLNIQLRMRLLGRGFNMTVKVGTYPQQCRRDWRPRRCRSSGECWECHGRREGRTQKWCGWRLPPGSGSPQYDRNNWGTWAIYWDGAA